MRQKICSLKTNQECTVTYKNNLKTASQKPKCPLETFVRNGYKLLQKTQCKLTL